MGISPLAKDGVRGKEERILSHRKEMRTANARE